MKNMPIGAIKPKEDDDDDDVQVMDIASSLRGPQDDDKDGREKNEDTQVPLHPQEAQDHDAPQVPPQVVTQKNTPLLQAHPQDLIIGSPTKGVMTRSQKLASFIEHHSFVSCFEPTCIEEALQDPDWINAMHEELNNFTHNEV